MVLLLEHCSVVTMDDGREGPLNGPDQNVLKVIKDGALAVANGHFLAVDCRDDVRRFVEHVGDEATTVDLAGRLVLPGLVDPHTHLVWAGSRVEEFESRSAGVSYQSIAAAGGGIMSTVRATRAAGSSDLLHGILERLDTVLDHGVTTVEVKSGYGLALDAELRQLDAVQEAAKRHPVNIVPTFLGAHAIPAEYSTRRSEYIDLVIEEMIPAVVARYGHVFCDVFCDAGALNVDEATAILRAARTAGMPLKAHVDEFERLGMTSVAAALGATSCDHLMRAEVEDRAALAAAGTVAVLLPGTTVGLGERHFADGRALVDAGVAVALATDWNPGSSPCSSLPLVIALACRYCGLTPAEALVAVTRNAACAIGADGVAGRLAVGRPADLAVADTNDPRDLAYRFGANPIVAVMVGGSWQRPLVDDVVEEQR